MKKNQLSIYISGVNNIEHLMTDDGQSGNRKLYGSLTDKNVQAQKARCA